MRGATRPALAVDKSRDRLIPGKPLALVCLFGEEDETQERQAEPEEDDR